MKKLKILLLALAATISVGAWAQEWTDITYENVTTSEDNLLVNPSFETLGSVKSGTQYNIGEPWTWNISNASIRVEPGKTYANMNGESVLIWRGSGNSWYISQSVSGIKPNTWYEVKMSQVDRGNANADFNVGIGTEAGKYDVGHATIRLGNNINNDVKKVHFLTPSTAEESAEYYFTFANTPNNTASSGSDPVTQLDWISLVECCEDGYFSNPLDVTNFLTNPSFEKGDFYGWVNNGMQTQDNNSFDKKEGIYYAEKWQASGGLPNCSILQTIDNIPNGYYRLTVAAGFDGNGAYIVANESKKEFHANNDYSVIVNVTEGELTVGVKLENSTANYVRFDNFRLEYFGNTLQASEDNPIDLTSCIGTNKESWTGATGIYSNCVEHFIWGGTETGEYLSQTVSNLPIGKYLVEMYCAVSSTSSRDNEGSTLIDPDGSDEYVTINANEVSKNIPAYNRLEVTNIPSYTLENVTVSDGTLKLSVNILKANPNWIVANIKSLKYIGPGLDDLNMILSSVITNAESLYDSKMNSDVLQALKDKVSEARSVGQEANAIKAIIEELQTAIANANASIADYAKLKAAIDLAKEYTVVDETYETLATTIKTAEGIYNNGTVETCAETITGLDEAVKAAKVADYTYVSSKYLYSVNLGTWNETDGVADFSNEHWSGETHSYKNQEDGTNLGYNSSTGFSIGLNQDVKLPKGKYVFKACGRKSDLATLELIVKVKDGDELGRVSDFPSSNNAKGINKDGVTSFEGDNFAHDGNGFGWQWRFVEFELNEETTINVAVSALATTKYQWVSFGDYSVLTDSENNIAMIAYNIALNDAKLALDNNAYKNVTGAELTALKTAINFETTGKTKAEIEEATAALQEATTAFKEAAPAYDNYVAVLEKVKNLDDAGKAKFAELTAEIKAKYDNNTICKADLVNVTDFYFAAVKAQTTIGSDWSGLIVNSSFEETTDVWNNGWTTDRNTTGNFDYKLLEESATGITDGKYVLNAWASQINYIRVSQSINLPVGVYELSAAVYSDLVKDQHIEAIVNDNHYKSAIVNNNKWEILLTQFIVSEEGDVTIGIYSNGNNKGGDQYGWFRVDNFKLKYCGPVKSANMTIKEDAKWGTFCAPFDVTIPEGVKAYTAKEEDNTVAFTEVETTIPAGTPVVVYSAETVDKNYFGVLNTEETCTEGVLVGVYAETSDIEATENHTNYVLQNNAQGVGFYKVAKGSTISLNANRCYMTLPTSSAAKDCVVLDGIVTGINNILNPTDKSAEGIYDLNGRKLAAPQKGINIINGVKVIVK